MFKRGDLVRFIGSDEKEHELQHGTVTRIACDWGEGHPHRYNLEGYYAFVAEQELELVQATAGPHVCACETCTCDRTAA